MTDCFCSFPLVTETVMYFTSTISTVDKRCRKPSLARPQVVCQGYKQAIHVIAIIINTYLTSVNFHTPVTNGCLSQTIMYYIWAICSCLAGSAGSSYNIIQKKCWHKRRYLALIASLCSMSPCPRSRLKLRFKPLNNSWLCPRIDMRESAISDK